MTNIERARAPRLWTVTGLLAIGLSLSHLLSLRNFTAITGPLLILDNLFTVVLATALLLVGAGLGVRVMRSLGTDNGAAVDTLAFAMILGLGILGTAILLLGEVGALRTATLSLALIVGVWAAWPGLARLPDLGRRATEEISGMAGPPELLLLVVVAGAMLIQSVAPATDYDSLMYHLQGPAQFLGRGAIFLPEGNPHVAYVGLAHMLYLPALAFGAPAAPAVLNTFFALGLAIVLVRMGTRFFSRDAGRLASVLIWGSPMMILVAMTPKVDVALALYLLLGHYGLLHALDRPREAGPWLVLSGLLLGFAFGVKYSALIYVLALAPVLLLVLRGASSKTPSRFRMGGAFGLALVVASFPWLLKNWLLFGAPVYPYLSDPFTPSWLGAIGGSAHLSATAGNGAANPLAMVREPFNLLDWFLHPERMTPESEGAAYGANLAFVFVLAAVPLLRRRLYAALLLPGVLYVCGLLLVDGGRINLRYLTPALPVLTLASASALTVVLGYLRKGTLRVGVVSLVAVLALFPSGTVLAGRLLRTRAPSLAIGGLSRRQYRGESRDPEIYSYDAMTRSVNRQLPANAKVLMLFEGRGYGFSEEVLQDNVVTNWPLLSAALSPSRCLEGSGITHVLVGTGTLQYFVSRGLDPRAVHWDQFADFQARCLRPVDLQPSFALFAVVQP